MKRRGKRVGIALGGLAVIVGGVQGFLTLAEGSVAERPTQPPATRPAAKSTCAQARVTQLPTGMQESERELVPFSATQLGVNTVISDGSTVLMPVISSRSMRTALSGARCSAG